MAAKALYRGSSTTTESRNTGRTEAFRTATVRNWLKALRHPSQRYRMTWEEFDPLVDRWSPESHVLHPHPTDRFYAKPTK